MGIAIIDARARFQAINETLAGMNRLPARNHIGKKLRFVLGPKAATLEDWVHQVLETRKPIANFEFTAKLPGRTDMGRWIGSYLPVPDGENRVTRVVALVAELTDCQNLEVSLSHMLGNLLHASAALKTELQFHAATGRWSDERGGLLPKAIELIDHCIGHT
jgi:transcriptional regulator with PAS, ATPase and Fis domain